MRNKSTPPRGKRSWASALAGVSPTPQTSPWGILALTIIGLAVLAFFFFRQASEKTRIGIFATLFLGVVVLAGTVVRVSNKAVRGPGPNPPPTNPTNGRVANVGGQIGRLDSKYPKKLIVPGEDIRTHPGTYRILSATLDQLSDDKLTLDFEVRYTRGNDAWSGETLMAENFRLFVDDVPLAPTKAPIEAVAVNSAKEGHVIFTIPS